MPTRTLAALIARAMAEGLDPCTPAMVVFRATLPDQAVVVAPISELATALAKADLGGQVLVMVGRVIGGVASAQASGVRRQHG